MLSAAGVDLIGLPLRLDVHPQDVAEAEAAEIVAEAGIVERAVVITYECDPREILHLCRAVGVGIIQLHAAVPPRACAELKRLDSGLILIKSLVVRSGNQRELTAAQGAYTPHVDAFLTDTFDPESKASGATGKTHDWAVSAALARNSARPVILAGGLTADNVGEAIRTVRPWGVDAHTGLEDAAGRKDERKVRAFVRAARAAFRESE